MSKERIRVAVPILDSLVNEQDPYLGRGPNRFDKRQRAYGEQIRQGDDPDGIGIAIDAFLRLHFMRLATYEPDNRIYRQLGIQEDNLDRFKFPNGVTPHFTSEDEETLSQAYNFISGVFGRRLFSRVVEAYVESVSANFSLQIPDMLERRVSL